MRYHQITRHERHTLAALRRQVVSQAEMARQLNRHPSTISREFRPVAFYMILDTGNYHDDNGNDMAKANGVNEELARRVAEMRRFNRFYTRQLGLLQEHLLESEFSLAEARVLYEIADRTETTSTELSAELGIDPGYLSRIVRSLASRRLLDKRVSSADGRLNPLGLTARGRQAFARLDRDSRKEVETVLKTLPRESQDRLVAAMLTIRQLLSGSSGGKVPYILRPYGPGDMGWVVQCHGALYADEYGWDEQFEALVAEIVARFIRKFDPKRDRCWIAEQGGENVGSVFLVRKSDSVAQLRLLLVHPRARGLGIGARLVDECTRFAKQAGYRKIVLWTNSVLIAARRLYEKAGYRLIEEEPHHSFGRDLVGQTWELRL